MTVSDRRSRLRAATMQTHARLDAMIGQAGFFDNRNRYAKYLLATWRVRSCLEAALDGQAPALFACWPQRRITAALLKDLRDVTGAEPSDLVEVLNPAIDTAAELLGVLYVLEGSALGARILLRRATSLGMTADFGARHLAAQVSMPKGWSSFLSILELTALTPGEDDNCTLAATATFLRFERAYSAVL